MRYVRQSVRNPNLIYTSKIYMTEYLSIATICLLLLQLLAAWHRDRVKDGHNPAVRRGIRVWAIFSMLVIVVSGANVYG